jgi:DNA polymerase-3 subunit epsilon
MIGTVIKLDRRLTVFDFETTGVDTSRDRAVSLAMRVHEPDGRVIEWQTLINPGRSIPAGASKVHGITDEIIAAGCARCWRDVQSHPAEDCEKFLQVPFFNHLADHLLKGLSNSDYAGYNVRFDLEIMQAEMRRCNKEFDPSKNRVVDGLKMWQEASPRTLTHAYKRWCNKTLDGAHNALNDVRATEEVIIAQLQHEVNGKRLFPDSVQAIYDLTHKRDTNSIDSEGKFVFKDGVPIINFGKKAKGQPMNSPDGMDFIRWMSRQTFSVEITKIVAAALIGDFPKQT